MIENCGGEEELKDVWANKENQKIIKSLEKRDEKLHSILVASKDAMKEEFNKLSG